MKPFLKGLLLVTGSVMLALLVLGLLMVQCNRGS